MSYLNKNARRWARGSLARRMAVGLLITIVAFAIRKVLHPYVQPHIPFHFAVAAAFITEFLVGLVPAFVSLVLGMALGIDFFIKPYDAFTLPKGDNMIVFATNVIIAIIAIVLLEHLRRSQYSTRLTFNVVNSQRRSLLEVYNQVLFQQRKSKGFVKELTSVFSDMDHILLLVPTNQPAFRMPAWYRILGPDAAMDAGTDWSAAVHPDERPMVEQEIAAGNQLPLGVSKPLRFRLRAGADEFRWVDASLHTIHYRKQWCMTVLNLGRSTP